MNGDVGMTGKEVVGLLPQSAMQSKTAIGSFIRRIRLRLGAPTAVNAGAHKLARLIYRMLKFGNAYAETGQQAYETLFKGRTLPNLWRKARELGFDVTPMAFTALLFLRTESPVSNALVLRI